MFRPFFGEAELEEWHSLYQELDLLVLGGEFDQDFWPLLIT
jgi:hypothetical protein